MVYLLSDSRYHQRFLPLTLTRATADLFMGLQTFRERWERALGSACGVHTEEYLSPLYPEVGGDDFRIIDPLWIPNEALIREIEDLEPGQLLVSGPDWIAYRTSAPISLEVLTDLKPKESQAGALLISQIWDLFTRNDEVLRRDFDEITRGRDSQEIDPSNQVVGEGQVFLEEGAEVLASVLNPSTGPIYIGRSATVMEGCLVRGGLALMDGATLKMGSKIYGACSFGKGSKLGGEINNSIVFPYSNKGHDGFLGNSVLGSWCNLGADTNTSNLKNNYAPVKLWGYASSSFVDTGLQFCGLIMGDHSKCGINTMFNTGTVVGVSANLFGAGFPRNFVPSFSWGGPGGYQEYRIDKALETARAMMARRSMTLSAAEAGVLEHIYELRRANQDV